jgi:23S rRNA pseudouridine1911/1915/1917 synthase
MLCDGGVISGTIDTNIIRDPNNRTLYKSVESRPPNALNNSAPAKGRRAVTHFRVLQSFSRHTLVEFRLETGRTHQIRVHAKSIGHPLAADPEYNPRGSLKPTGQLLESVEIDFIHPVTGARVHHKIPLGPEFQAVLSRLTRK